MAKYHAIVEKSAIEMKRKAQVLKSFGHLCKEAFSELVLSSTSDQLV